MKSTPICLALVAIGWLIVDTTCDIVEAITATTPGVTFKANPYALALYVFISVVIIVIAVWSDKKR